MSRVSTPLPLYSEEERRILAFPTGEINLLLHKATTPTAKQKKQKVVRVEEKKAFLDKSQTDFEFFLPFFLFFSTKTQGFFSRHKKVILLRGDKRGNGRKNALRVHA